MAHRSDHPDPRVVTGVECQAQMSLVLDDQPCNLTRGSKYAHVNLQTRVLADKAVQKRREGGSNEPLTHCETDAPGAQTLQIRQPSLENLALGQLRLVILDQKPTGLGEAQSARPMLNQGGPDFSFELRNLPADGGRSHSEQVCGGAHRTE